MREKSNNKKGFYPQDSVLSQVRRQALEFKSQLYQLDPKLWRLNEIIHKTFSITEQQLF